MGAAGPPGVSVNTPSLGLANCSVIQCITIPVVQCHQRTMHAESSSIMVWILLTSHRLCLLVQLNTSLISGHYVALLHDLLQCTITMLFLHALCHQPQLAQNWFVEHLLGMLLRSIHTRNLKTAWLYILPEVF